MYEEDVRLRLCTIYRKEVFKNQSIFLLFYTLNKSSIVTLHFPTIIHIVKEFYPFLQPFSQKLLRVYESLLSPYKTLTY